MKNIFVILFISTTIFSARAFAEKGLCTIEPVIYHYCVVAHSYEHKATDADCIRWNDIVVSYNLLRDGKVAKNYELFSQAEASAYKLQNNNICVYLE